MCCLKYDMVLLCALFHLILNGIGLKSSTLWMRRLRLTKVKGLPKAMSLRRAEKPVFWCLISLIPLNSVTGQRVVSYDVSIQAVDVHQHTHTYGSQRLRMSTIRAHKDVFSYNYCARCRGELGASIPSCHLLSPVTFP